MKISFFLATVASLALSGTAALAQSAGSSSESNSSSMAVGTGNGVVSTVISPSNAQQQGQQQAASANTSTAVTTDNKSGATATTGNTSATVNQNFEAGKPNVIPGAGFPAAVSLPQIFTQPGAGAGEKGIPLLASILSACNMDIGLGDMVPQTAIGKSGKTEMTVTLLPDYREQSEAGTISRVGVNLPVADNGGTYRYKCLGTITVQASQKFADSVDVSTLMGDAANYVLSNLQGPQRVYMVTAPQAYAAGSVLQNKSSGFGASPTLAALTGGASALISGVLGANTNSGRATMLDRLGGTYVLLAIDESKGASISEATLRKYYVGAIPKEEASTAAKADAAQPQQ